MRRQKTGKRKKVRFTKDCKRFDGLYFTKYFAQKIMNSYIQDKRSIHSFLLYQNIPNKYNNYTDIRYKVFLYFLHLRKQVDTNYRVRLFSSSPIIFYSNNEINIILKNLIKLLRE